MKLERFTVPTLWPSLHHKLTFPLSTCQPISGRDRFFYFLNTHFDHRSAEARQEAARLITKRVSTLAKDLPVVVTGDFNDGAEKSDPWRVFIEGGLADAWVEAGERVGPAVTWGGFEAPDPANTDRIDWILYRGSVNVQSCETVVFNEDGRYPSDHYPVLARFTFLD